VKRKNPLWWTAILLSICLLSGCGALLERSYSVVEPYADRYWDPGAEDTLRAESYQDLVNSLLLLIEQHAEDGVIRCYGETGAPEKVNDAKREVRKETMLGSYLLRDLQISAEEGANYSTLTCRMSYREDTEEIVSIMTLSDSQSLVDLLRITVREEREKLTAHFAYDTSGEDVIAAVESLWQELCRSEMEENAVPPAQEEPPDTPPELDEESPPEKTAEEPVPEEPPEEEPEHMPEPQSEAPVPDLPASGTDPDIPDGETPPEEPIVYPPCPWIVRFYPNQDAAEKIVEVLLNHPE